MCIHIYIYIYIIYREREREREIFSPYQGPPGAEFSGGSPNFEEFLPFNNRSLTRGWAKCEILVEKLAVRPIHVMSGCD